MKFLKWFFGILIFLIIAVAVAAYIFLKNFDLNKYKNYAEKIVYEQTGRKLTIAGDASLGISLIPTIVINDVSFANPEWAKNPQMVKVGALELRFSLLPLLSKQIVVDRALLKSPQIFLETAKDGQNSWDFKLPDVQPEKAASAGGWMIVKTANAAETGGTMDFLSDFVAREVVISDGTVEYYNHKDKSSKSLGIKNIAFSTDGINSPMNVSWDIVFDGMTFSGSGELGSLAALLSGVGEYPLKLDIKALGLGALLNAKIKDMMNDKLSAVFDYNVYNPAGNMNAPETTVIGTGNATLKKVSLNISNLSIVNNKLQGKVSADISGAKPFVSADITGNSFNLESLNKALPTASNFELVKSAHASALVPDTLIPYELLKIADGNFSVALKELIVNSDLVVKNLVLKAALSGGVLNVKPLDFNLGQGSVNLTAIVSSVSKSLTLNATAKDVLMGDLHKEFKVDNQNDFGILSGGNTQSYISLKGSGSTVRSLTDNLNGQIIAVVEPSKLQSGQLKFLTNSFVSQLLNILKIDTRKSETVDLKCAVVRADFNNGTITFPKGIAVNSDKLDLVSSGTLNLRNDKLNLSINAYRSGIADVSIVQAVSNLVKIGGTLQNPKIAIDESGALKTIAGAALSGGTLTGAQMLLDKDTAPCYTALKGTIYQDKFPKPTGASNAAQKTYQGASQVIDDGVGLVKDGAKEIKNTAKDIFKNILKK